MPHSEAKTCLAYQTEPEGSLPCSQQPAKSKTSCAVLHASILWLEVVIPPSNTNWITTTHQLSVTIYLTIPWSRMGFKFQILPRMKKIYI
jgi:hypothetical protein